MQKLINLYEKDGQFFRQIRVFAEEVTTQNRYDFTEIFGA